MSKIEPQKSKIVKESISVIPENPNEIKIPKPVIIIEHHENKAAVNGEIRNGKMDGEELENLEEIQEVVICIGCICKLCLCCCRL